MNKPCAMSAEHACAYADLSALLSIALRCPNEQLVHGLADGSFWDDCTACCNELALDTAARPEACEKRGDLLAWGLSEDPETALHELRQEHTRLFAAPMEHVISPYESLFRNTLKEKPDEVFMFVNDCAMHMGQIMRKSHLTVASGVGEPEDYAPVELDTLHAFYIHLTQALTCGDSNAVQRWKLAIRELLDIHISKWMPLFFQKVEQESSMPFYRAVANLGAAFCKSAAQA